MEFGQIASLLVVAAIAASIAKILKQPLLVGYLFAGFLMSLLGIVGNIEVFSGLGQIGVALLLFLVGIEMNLSELPSIGKVAFITGIGQILFTTFFGFAISLLLGFAPLPALYIGVALSFSSTIIIVKLLSEKKDLGSLYGKISVGFLLVQDFVAVMILMFLAGFKNGQVGLAEIGIIAAKGIFLIACTWFLSRKILPEIFDKFFASSQELLFISSIAWALGVSAFVGGPFGFTLEIGGFLAGISLSNLPEHLQVASRTRPLRDFFLTIFFLLLGTHLVIGDLGGIILPAGIFSALVLFGNPLIVLSILGFLGYTKRTSFLSGLTVAQISEFSLILMVMGAALGHVTESHVAVIIIVGVVTMTVSSYFILGADKIYKRIKDYLRFFERKLPKEAVVNLPGEYSDHVVLIGADRTGKTIINYLKKRGLSFVVVDFSPHVFRELIAQNTPSIFGDISDPEIFEATGISRARLVVSTPSSLSVNLYLLENIRKQQRRPITIFTTVERDDGIKMYEKGADYVIVPQRVAGEHIRHVLATYGISEEKIKRLGKANFNRLMTK